MLAITTYVHYVISLLVNHVSGIGSFQRDGPSLLVDVAWIMFKSPRASLLCKCCRWWIRSEQLLRSSRRFISCMWLGGRIWHFVLRKYFWYLRQQYLYVRFWSSMTVLTLDGKYWIVISSLIMPLHPLYMRRVNLGLVRLLSASRIRNPENAYLTKFF